MKPVTVNLPRIERMHAWTGCTLRSDLSNMHITAQETAPYVPDVSGPVALCPGSAGRSVRACRTLPSYQSADGLPGALTGSRSPYSGRTNLCGFSPQRCPCP